MPKRKSDGWKCTNINIRRVPRGKRRAGQRGVTANGTVMDVLHSTVGQVLFFFSSSLRASLSAPWN